MENFSRERPIALSERGHMESIVVPFFTKEAVRTGGNVGSLAARDSLNKATTIGERERTVSEYEAVLAILGSSDRNEILTQVGRMREKLEAQLERTPDNEYVELYRIIEATESLKERLSPGDERGQEALDYAIAMYHGKLRQTPTARLNKLKKIEEKLNRPS